jgi:hypothetical protein
MAKKKASKTPSGPAVDRAAPCSAGREFFPCRHCGGFWVAREKVTVRGQYRSANCPDCEKDSVIDYMPHFLPPDRISDPAHKTPPPMPPLMLAAMPCSSPFRQVPKKFLK